MLVILKIIKMFKKYYQSIVVMWQHMFSMPVTRAVWRRELDCSPARDIDPEGGTDRKCQWRREVYLFIYNFQLLDVNQGVQLLQGIQLPTLIVKNSSEIVGSL
jgi:hypothetical protein